MKKHLIAFITLIIMSLTACSNQNVSETNIEKNNNIENAKLNHNVTLLVTSDIHGSVDENLTLEYVYDKREELKSRGDYTLLIDDGDLLQGSLFLSRKQWR